MLPPMEEFEPDPAIGAAPPGVIPDEDPAPQVPDENGKKVQLDNGNEARTPWYSPLKKKQKASDLSAGSGDDEENQQVRAEMSINPLSR